MDQSPLELLKKQLRDRAVLMGKDAMQKESRVRLNMLRKFLGKQKPLFHSVSGDNATGLLTRPRALTSTEAVSRGLAKNVESGFTAGRGLPNVTNIKPTLRGNSASVQTSDLLKEHVRRSYGKLNPELPLSMQVPTGSLQNIRYRGPIANYANASLMSDFAGAGPSKNWGTVSLSKTSPMRGYGEFGVMTTPSRFRNTGAVFNDPRISEVQLMPKWQFNAQKMPVAATLPSADGKIFYHPSRENAGLARKLIARYGRHNVIPWNRATRSRMNVATRNSSDLPFRDIEDGNWGFRELERKIPGHEQAGDDVHDWVTQQLNS